ncbi:MAG: T9SS type A sorting domain-containing protein, partial [Flavobacteriaceae bacterium]
TPLGEVVGLDGCVIFYLPAKNFNVFKTERCIGENSITLQVQDPSYTYNVAVSGAANTNESFTGSTWELDNLSGGTYSICITVDGVDENIFQRCFEISITDPEPLNVYAMANLDNQTVTYNLKGGSVYKITHNGKTTQTQNPTHTIALEKGMNKVTITTGVACQGIFEATYLNSYEVQMAPNPFKEQLIFNVGGTDRDVKVEIYAPDGRLMKTAPFILSTSNRIIVLPTDDLIQGSYYIKVLGENTDQSFKAIKE